MIQQTHIQCNSFIGDVDDVQYPPKKKRRYFQPRYISEVTSEDFSTPEKTLQTIK